MFQIQYLGLGGILDQGIAVMKARFGLLFSIVLVTIVPVQFLFGLVQLEMVPGLQSGDPEVIQANLPLIFGMAGASLLLFLLILPLANAAVIHAVASTYLSRPTTLGECLRHGLRRWPALIGTSILVTIVCALGFVLCIVPGIIFSLWYALAQHVTVLEDTAGTGAMARSKELTKGNLGSAFVLGFLVGIINSAGNMLLSLIPQVHLNLLGQAVMAGVATVFGAAVFVVFYFSCRCKAENFDLEMLADAVADEGDVAPQQY